ncbi:hypothetical protein F4808DRAFT_454359 [Astrocystis sublimbata]|nr:hypothetical protein F4808DRAFT_454359 [Astrocystis sublimbata]
MDPFILAEPLLFFSFTTALFVFAMKTPPSSVKRQILAGFHVLLVAMSLQASPLVLSFYPGITIPFVIGVTFHTTALIIFDQHVMDLRSLSFSQQAWALMRTWMNIRRLARAGYPDYHEKITGSSERLSFLICQSYQIIILWAVGRVIGVLYPATVSVHWIWATYHTLSLWHCALGILSVVALRWDNPSDWPPLFGSVFESYSLRRFWGVFWHRLHVAPFSAWIPPSLHRIGAVRALWIFLLSGACHAMVNWTMYHHNTFRHDMRFFLTSYALCLVETIVSMARRRIGANSRGTGSKPSFGFRLLGYCWVITFLVCTVPGWHYPLIYHNLALIEIS